MNAYTEQIVRMFAQHHNAEDAVAMKQYMRNQFEFLGIRKPQRESLFKQFIQEQGVPSIELLPDIITELWNLPEREYQYTALDILAKSVKRLNPNHMSLLERLIVNKSWWDTVDGIAPNMAGHLLRQYPELIAMYAEPWIESDNMWLNRSAILFQLKYKQHTDEKLLYDYIVRKADSNEFFIQKAIGWALREYAKTNPGSVQQFIDSHELKPLSRREGLKHLQNA
ncbi:DNA alkylation repair protein [Paenibacillus sp. H1-7]|uniref:DNA alkylation repair protein n=1 Tax=Paenibacillus sp. H1-7 TaxID=2282849 RepID=UPI001EF85F00|nr:DNA alkylation repair protein [Paenibacillus sp. H1-7]ULL18062.1 DNA alkylation repair protein [Paenibacillus sp. H1-7]